jgi:hypothetical protein
VVRCSGSLAQVLGGMRPFVLAPAEEISHPCWTADGKRQRVLGEDVGLHVVLTSVRAAQDAGAEWGARTRGRSNRAWRVCIWCHGRVLGTRLWMGASLTCWLGAQRGGAAERPAQKTATTGRASRSSRVVALSACRASLAASFAGCSVRSRLVSPRLCRALRFPVSMRPHCLGGLSAPR